MNSLYMLISVHSTVDLSHKLNPNSIIKLQKQQEQAFLLLHLHIGNIEWKSEMFTTSVFMVAGKLVTYNEVKVTVQDALITVNHCYIDQCTIFPHNFVGSWQCWP